MKNIRGLSENFQFLEVNFSIYLNRRVFVMIVGNKNDYPGTPCTSACQIIVFKLIFAVCLGFYWENLW